jgi:predicted Fe-S protein YdhL (DUF1289 family)
MDEVWKRQEVESPCVKLCVIHPEARIFGCYRSIDEIGAWSGMSAEARRAVMADLPERESTLTKRRGGRRARVARD